MRHKRPRSIPFLISIVILLTGNPTYAQTPLYEIKGSLIDSLSGEPVSFATALLLKNGERKAGVNADAKGVFSLKEIPAGTYQLRFFYLGYKELVINNINVSKKTVDLGTLKMAPDNKMLSEVTVTARANLIQDKGDMIVYNAENDISNTGGSAIDVLRKTPMLSVDASGNIQMLGSSSIKVLINGKPSNIVARNLADALKMIPANTIKSVEVITSPSAKYDAEGIGGVINIITKKNLRGSNGNLALTAGNRSQNFNGGYNIRAEKLGMNVNGYYGQYLNEGNSFFHRFSSDQTLTTDLSQDNSFKNTGRGWGGDLGVTYDADTLNLFSLSVSHWGQTDPNNSALYSRSLSGNSTPEEYRQYVDYSNPYGNIAADLSYTHRFRKPKQELVLLSQYSTTYDDYRYTTDRLDMSGVLIYRDLSKNKSNSDELTVQSDYTHPFDTTGRKTLESGAKLIVRKVASDYQVENTSAGDIGHLDLDPSLSDAFNYTQRVFSLYSSFKINTASGWMFMGGARLEHTYMEGDFVTSASAFRNDYFNFVPNFTASAKINKIHQLKVSYTQRISRPQVWNLNPYQVSTDGKNIWTGNPHLRPELSHYGQFGYNVTLKDGITINTTLYRRQANNAIQHIVTVQEDGSSLSRPENSGKQVRQGFSMNISADITKSWSVSSNSDYYHNHLSSPQNSLSNSGWFWYANLNTSYKLPQKYTLQLYGNYNSGWMWLQGRSRNTFYYSASLKKQFLNDKASLTLNIDNPFNQYIRQQSGEIANGFNTDRINHYINRSFRLSFNWQFGKMSEGKENQVKKVENDDRSSR